MVMYEIWSLGHKPFEEFSIQEVRSMMFSFVLKVNKALYSLKYTVYCCAVYSYAEMCLQIYNHVSLVNERGA